MQIEKSTQTFSSTDLAKDDIPGIVFPLKEADGVLSVSSIIDHKSRQKVSICNSEARLVFKDGDNINYYKMPHIALMSANFDEVYPSSAAKLLGVKPIITGYEEYALSSLGAEITPTVTALFEVFKTLEFKPSIELVKADNLTTKKVIHKEIKTPYMKFKDESNLTLFNIKEFHSLERNNKIKILEDIEKYIEGSLLTDYKTFTNHALNSEYEFFLSILNYEYERAY